MFNFFPWRKRFQELYYIFFLSCSLYAKSFIRFKKKKKKFLNGSPSVGDGVFISLCVRRFLCEPRREQTCVLLKWSECVEMRVPTVRREGKGTPFCGLNPRYW